MDAKLIRVEKGSEGTFGIYCFDNIPFCVVLEPVDIAGAMREGVVDCIPEGIYVCKRVNSPRFGETFEVTNVPGKSHILHHSGNKVEHTLGCLLLAQHFGKLKGERAVLNSGKTFSRYMERLAGIDEYKLSIETWC